MISRRLIPVIVLLLTGATLIAAEDFMVTYLEGKAELKSGTAWLPLKLGAKLPESSVLRLAADGLLECSRTGVVVTIARGGTFALKDLVKPSRTARGASPLASVDSKIRRVAGDEAGRREKYAALGVRGAPTAQNDGPMFVAEEPEDPLADGAALLEGEKFAEAIVYFQESLEKPVEPAARDILRYHLAYAYSRNRQNALALRQVETIDVKPDSPIYPDYVLLKGRLLFGSYAYDRALALLDEYLLRQPRGDAAQAALLMSAYCREGLGDKPRAKELLQKTVAFDPATDEGKEAAEALKGM